MSQSAAHFGLSRPSFYQALAAFEQGGLPALMPQKRGPKKAHKLTAEVLAFIRQAQQEDSSLRAPSLAALVQNRYGISVHPRSIERALTRRRQFFLTKTHPPALLSKIGCLVMSNCAVMH